MADVKIAKQFGVSRTTVRNARVAAGIKPSRTWVSRGSIIERRERPRNKLTAGKKAIDHPLLGKISDYKLAKELGIGASTVSHARALSGIPAAHQKYGPSEAPKFVTASERINELIGED
jgi:hypothetical protein